MCVVSFIGDEYARDFPKRWPQVPIEPVIVPGTGTGTTFEVDIPITRKEFNALKEEVEALKELLKAAKVFDEVSGQPDCEMEEKVDLIRRIADFVGVDLEEVFGEKDT